MEIGNVYSNLDTAKEFTAEFAQANKLKEVYITVSVYGREKTPEFYLKGPKEIINKKSPNVLFMYKNGELKQLHEFKPQQNQLETLNY